MNVKLANKMVPFLFLLLLLISCSDHSFKEGKYFAGGKYVTAETLNTGKMVYTEYCMACHGINGDGKGVASKGLVPPPRDFTLGLFKFGRVAAGELPTDEDFKHIIRYGLKGTGMLAWDMSDRQIDAVTQYVKTFSPQTWEGKEKTLGAVIPVSVDPFGESHKTAAVERGKAVYHVVAQCQSCHRAYVSKGEMADLSKKINNETVTEFDANFYEVKLQDSQYNFKTLPPDFTWHNVRSAATVEELYVRISSGVGGTAMPGWKDTLSNEDIWATAHYIRSLMDMKDQKTREELMEKLK